MRITTETKYKAVARYMATGIPLEVICGNLGLSLDRWRQVVGESVFKDILRQTEENMDERLGEVISEDPVFIKMKMAGKKAVDRIVEEIDNFAEDQGANAGTRLKAAEGILSRIGYYKTDLPINAASIKIEISGEKAKVIDEAKVPTEDMDCIKV